MNLKERYKDQWVDPKDDRGMKISDPVLEMWGGNEQWITRNEKESNF